MIARLKVAGRALAPARLRLSKLPHPYRACLILAVIVFINYLPALDLDDYPSFFTSQTNNISSAIVLRVLDFPSFLYSWNDDNYSFNWEWYTAAQLVQGQTNSKWHFEDQPPLDYYRAAPSSQLPLWRYDDRDGGRPLLVLSKAPILYPLSLLYYWGGHMTVFAAFHAWLGLVGMWLLAGRIPFGWSRWGRPLLLLLTLLVLTPLRPDAEAALAWLPLGLWLALKPLNYWRTVELSLIGALIWLAVSLPLSLILVGFLTVWWLTAQSIQYFEQPKLIGQKIAMIALSLMLGSLLAAPQLWPRFFDHMESYQKPPDPYGWQISPAGAANLLQVIRISDSQVAYRIDIKQDITNLHLIVPERYDPGWTALVRKEDSFTYTYEETDITPTTEGWRSIALPRRSYGTGIIDLQTSYRPRKFQAGIYAALLALLVILIGAGWKVRHFIFLKITKVRE